jgi:hypothetical protein
MSNKEVKQLKAALLKSREKALESKENAIKYLTDAGILGKDGKLSPNYK